MREKLVERNGGVVYRWQHAGKQKDDEDGYHFKDWKASGTVGQAHEKLKW